MIANVYMKSIWNITRPNEVNEWLYPSNHMIAAFVFWGWLVLEIKNKSFTAFVILMLWGVGNGLAYFDFHMKEDVQGAIYYGFGWLIVYYFLWKIKILQQYAQLMGILLFLLAIPIVWNFPHNLYNLFPQIWAGLGILFNLPIAWWLNKFIQRPFNLKQRLFAFLIALLGVYWLMKNKAWLQSTFTRPQACFIEFSLITIWVCFLVNLIIYTSSALLKKITSLLEIKKA